MIRFVRALSFLVALPFLAAALNTTTEEGNCPHGLTANDIAERSGIDLTGKTALVTGGRSGLGYAISEALLRQNCTVVIASRSEEENQAAVESLKTTIPGADVSYAIFDLEDFSSVRGFASSIIGNHTHLDYYFANAGQGYSESPLTVDGYEPIFQVNYLAQFLLLELILPLMRKSEPARIMLTGSSSHTLSCGVLGLSTGVGEDSCFDGPSDDNAIAMLPFDQAGLDAVNNTFYCPPLAGTYPLTKFLMTQLAKEISEREADAGNEVYAYTWAPGNIRTNLNPWASCCVGPTESFGPTCRYQLPYVGPTDERGNPDRPDPPVPNHWSSPAHGTMAALYAALHAPASEAGSFFATYWECEENEGYFPQGITDGGRTDLYERSLEWAGISRDAAAAGGGGGGAITASGAIEVTPSVDEEEGVSQDGAVVDDGAMVEATRNADKEEEESMETDTANTLMGSGGATTTRAGTIWMLVLSFAVCCRALL